MSLVFPYFLMSKNCGSVTDICSAYGDDLIGGRYRLFNNYRQPLRSVFFLSENAIFKRNKPLLSSTFGLLLGQLGIVFLLISNKVVTTLI